MGNFTRIRRDDGWYNFLKPDGTLLSKEWFKYASNFDKGFARVLRKYGWYKLATDGTLYKDE